MGKVIKTGLMYVFAIILAVVIVGFVNFANKYQLNPKEVYKVYLDGKEIGNITDKQELEDYINDEQTEFKRGNMTLIRFIFQKVFDIQKCTTYESDVLTAKQVNNIIKEEKPFTVEGYTITIKSNSDDEEDLVINVLDKDIFDESIKSVVKAFVTEEDMDNYANDTQPEIKDTGTIIEDIYIDQDITIKHGYISTDEQIFTDEKTLTKYLMFGEVKEDQYYTVQEGDTIDSIAYDHKLATEEFFNC